jgi:hypothetical protein
MPVASLRSNRIAIPAGQSNGDSGHLGVAWFVPLTFAMASLAVGGTSMASYWANGMTGFNALKALINQQTALFPSAKIYIVWIHGEADAQVVGTASAYGAAMVTMADALESQTGRSDLIWIDFLLATDIDTGQDPFFATLNTGKSTTWLSSRPSRVLLQDVSGTGAMTDGIHWNATRVAYAKTLILAAAV